MIGLLSVLNFLVIFKVEELELVPELAHDGKTHMLDGIG
jgi:hypothetical protein